MRRQNRLTDEDAFTPSQTSELDLSPDGPVRSGTGKVPLYRYLNTSIGSTSITLRAGISRSATEASKSAFPFRPFQGVLDGALLPGSNTYRRTAQPFARCDPQLLFEFLV
jgi:hypothetical protein